MKRSISKHPTTLEDDIALWEALGQATHTPAPPRFADDTCRAARLLSSRAPWWTRVFSPLPMAGMATAAAAITLAVVSVRHESAPATLTMVESSEIDEIQDAADTEALCAAIDHIDRFSDMELASLCDL